MSFLNTYAAATDTVAYPEIMCRGGGTPEHLPSPPLPFPPLPFRSFASSPLLFLFLEVGPLNPARGSGGAL